LLRITNAGLLELKFSKEMQLDDLSTRLNNTTGRLLVTDEDRYLMPFQVDILPGLYSNSSNLTYQIEVTDFNSVNGFNIQV